MKVYFINPNEDDLKLYYMYMSDDTDINTLTRINLGYADRYEMKKSWLSFKYFSTDAINLEIILKERKQKKIIQAYKNLISRLKDEIGNKDGAILHDSIDAPF